MEVGASFIMKKHQDSQYRKECPVFSGFFNYFPEAIMEVSRCSYLSNEKHNPGEPLHWSREKSDDHLDACGRHMLKAGGVDPEDGIRETAKAAWRALAALQVELENEESKNQKLPTPQILIEEPPRGYTEGHGFQS